jgi:hypothetical protein
MRRVVLLIGAALVVTAISGCSTTTHNEATYANACSIARDAFAKILAVPLSQPYRVGRFCQFGIAKNSTKHGAAIGVLSIDGVEVAYNRSHVDSLYQVATTFPGNRPLRGIGNDALYWDSGDGHVQVFARTQVAYCWVSPNLASASEVGLSPSTGSSTISRTDLPTLANKLGTVCKALFGQ